MSAKDKLERKKYIGLWRCESELTVRMMRRFPSIVTKYMNRNSPKRLGCSCGSSESPMRWNSEIYVKFFSSILLGHLLKTNERIGENE